MLRRSCTTTTTSTTTKPRRSRFVTDSKTPWNLNNAVDDDDSDPRQLFDGLDDLVGPRHKSLRPTREAVVGQVHPAVVLKRRQVPPKEDPTSSPATISEMDTSRRELALRLSQPLIVQDDWDQMLKEEEEEEDNNMWFQQDDAVESLTNSGLRLCAMPASTTTSTSKTRDDPQQDDVTWTPHGSTTKVLDEYHQDKEAALKDGNILVYVGTIQKENVVGYGLPMIRTESILPLSAQDMASLLMDSTKVTIYNKLSLGRTDVRILHNDPTTTTTTTTTGKSTKIVRNLTQPPLSKSSMVSVTLMHSRPLKDDDPLSTQSSSSTLSPSKMMTSNQGYVVVSRAVPTMVGTEFKDMPRNDILMGVNVLQDRMVVVGDDQQKQGIPSGECFMTAVTHVYSPMLPKMLAKSMGVTSAVNFVQDIRESCRRQ